MPRVAASRGLPMPLRPSWKVIYDRRTAIERLNRPLVLHRRFNSITVRALKRVMAHRYVPFIVTNALAGRCRRLRGSWYGRLPEPACYAAASVHTEQRRVTCSICGDVCPESILIQGELCFFMDTGDPVLVGGGMILPYAHRESVFDLTHEEWLETQSLIHQAKRLLDERYQPDEYNVGWNCGEVAGQDTLHAHMHIIPRFKDEPLAGQGIRHHLKQPENRRASH